MRKPQHIDMTGQKYGRVTFLRYLGADESCHTAIWLCRCDCGVTFRAYRSNVVNGSTRSCGCLRKEVSRYNAWKRNKLGLSYGEWEKMIEAKKEADEKSSHKRGRIPKAVVALNDDGEYKYCGGIRQASKVLGIDNSGIVKCCKGQRKKCGGLRWFYFDDDQWTKLIRK